MIKNIIEKLTIYQFIKLRKKLLEIYSTDESYYIVLYDFVNYKYDLTHFYNYGWDQENILYGSYKEVMKAINKILKEKKEMQEKTKNL